MKTRRASFVLDQQDAHPAKLIPSRSEMDLGRQLNAPRRLRRNRLTEKRRAQVADIAHVVHAIEDVERFHAELQPGAFAGFDPPSANSCDSRASTDA